MFPEGAFDAILHRLTRGTDALNAIIRESHRLLAPGGSLWACGGNKEGIKSFAGRAEDHFGNAEILTVKSSCRLVRFRKSGPVPCLEVPDPGYFEDLRHTVEIPLAGSLTYATKAGIFSYRHTDPGTALLLGNLPDCAGLSVLDLGCGSGVVSLAAFRRGASAVTAVDANAIAVACARRNFRKQGFPGIVRCGNLTEDLAGSFDLILSNPPFHRGGKEDFSLPGRVLDSLLPLLAPQGRILLVANQFLDYPAQSRRLGLTIAPIAREKGYAVWRLSR